MGNHHTVRMIRWWVMYTLDSDGMYYWQLTSSGDTSDVGGVQNVSNSLPLEYSQYSCFTTTLSQTLIVGIDNVGRGADIGDEPPSSFCSLEIFRSTLDDSRLVWM